MSDDKTCPDCGARRQIKAAAELGPGYGVDAEFALESEDEVEPDLSLPETPGGDHDFLLNLSFASERSRAPDVLNALAETVGSVPPVLLRDGEAGDAGPVRLHFEPMPDLATDTGRYHLFGEIARGGMGIVLKGRDVDLSRDVALKVLMEKHRDQPEMVRRFVEEAQIGGQLQHPGIVPVYELGQFPDRRLYIAMKLVAGRTLAAMLQARDDPAEDQARFLSVFEQVCQTMAYAHARGVIHRDLKPSNVMVGSFGEVQVMDWGIAKVLDQGGVTDRDRSPQSRDESSAISTVRTGSDTDESRAGLVMGTLAYMAPEQARGALDTLDERADVFGLGSILCEILTGQPAYTGRTGEELYRKAEGADLADTRSRLDACGADAELVALARSCLAAAPTDRPRDAGGVAAVMTTYLAGVQERLREAGLAEARASARAAEERKRRLLTMALAASVLVTTLLGGGGWAWMARDRAGRVAKTALEVNQALEVAALLRGQARAAQGGDQAKWENAIGVVKLAEALLARGEGSSDLHDRVLNLMTSIFRERDAALSIEKDRKLVERLAEIDADYAVHLDASRKDLQYAEAFQDRGIEVDAVDSTEAGTRIAARPVAAELAAVLDDWTFDRRQRDPPDLEGARRLATIAKAADPDPWRNRLRDTLDLMTSDRKQALAVLERLAATVDPDSLPATSARLLAGALSGMGDKSTGIFLLRRAQRALPGDFWINWDLGNALKREGQLDEAIRFFSVAVALRPWSGRALQNLGVALHERGRLEDAAASFREAIRLGPDDPRPHLDLGAVLTDQGESQKAEAEFLEAKRLKEANPQRRGAAVSPPSR